MINIKKFVKETKYGLTFWQKLENGTNIHINHPKTIYTQEIIERINKV
jgi:hypothetical protein